MGILSSRNEYFRYLTASSSGGFTDDSYLYNIRPCGKCAQEHETKNCQSETRKCALCKGPHAWEHECPACDWESERMEAKKDVISPFYTSWQHTKLQYYRTMYIYKSKERTHSILNDPDTKHYAILMPQEQYYMKSSHSEWTTDPNSCIHRS